MITGMKVELRNKQMNKTIPSSCDSAIYLKGVDIQFGSVGVVIPRARGYLCEDISEKEEFTDLLLKLKPISK